MIARYINNHLRKEHYGWVKNKWIKTCILSLFMIFIFLLPTYEVLHIRNHREIEIDNAPIEVQLGSNQVVQQQIFLDQSSGLEEIGIWLSVEETGKEAGQLTITLKQEEREVKKYINVNAIVDKTFTTINVKTADFHSGNIELMLSTENLSDGIVSVRFSEDAIYGLQSASVDNVAQNGNLSVKYNIVKYNKEYWVSLLIIILAIITISVSAYIICCLEENKNTGVALFITSILLIIELVSLIYPTLSYEAMAWAEGTTQFYDAAAHRGLKGCLLTLEGGLYLSSINTIFMVLAVRVLHLQKNLFIFLQYISLLLRALCIAPICLHYFKGIYNRLARFLIAILSITLFLPSFYYISTGYAGVFLMILLLLCDCEKMSRKVVAAFAALCILFGMSKIFFIVFFPVGICYFILFWEKKNRKKNLLIGVMTVSCLFETIFSLVLSRGVATGSTLGTIQHVTLFKLINKLLYFTIQFFNAVLLHNCNMQNEAFINVLGIIIVCMILCFCAIQILGKRSYIRHCKYILLMFVLIESSIGLELLTTTDLASSIRWDKVTELDINAHFLFPYIAVICVFLILLDIVIKYLAKAKFDMSSKEKKQAATILTIFLAVIFTIQYPRAKEVEGFISNRYCMSDWATYSKMLDKESFCIKTEPSRWLYMRNSDKKRIVLSENKSEINWSDYSELVNAQDKKYYVFYVQKCEETNQVSDRYYYMSVYDRDNHLIDKVRQMNDDPERLHIGFYLDHYVDNIGRIAFEYEDGQKAYVEGLAHFGYQVD